MSWNLACLNMIAGNCMLNRQDVGIQVGSRIVGEGNRLVGDVVASIKAAGAATSSLRLSNEVLSPSNRVREEIAEARPSYNSLIKETD